ncbi:hypothetical protein HMN09_01418000 [Mycena chlorophos]|uniref:NAD(P)-binding protein n=1 Tax=Mycena chlorophos TaxID=658473 RepID=A0A8H6RWH3_MYCCL|nr:hypothetical protein HMN09_01418000 [Mycena chlorophos]
MPSYVVTGASRGIGFEFTNQLSADASNTVFALVRSPSTATQLHELAKSAAGTIVVVKADILDQAAIAEAVKVVAEHTGGKLDVLINNAAAIDSTKAWSLDAWPSSDALEEDLVNNFRTNAIAPIHVTNAFLPLLRAAPAAKAITISSGAGDPDFVRNVAGGWAAHAGYGMAKAALNVAVAKYAASMRASGGKIVFLAISPGIVDTSKPGDRTAEEQAGYESFVRFLGAERALSPTRALSSRSTVTRSGCSV